MSAPAHTYQRLIEDAVVTLLKADTAVNQTYKDASDTDYTPTIKRAYERSSEVTRLGIIAHARDLVNAMLGPTGRGAQWRCVLSVGVVVADANDKDNDDGDRVQGACERFVKGLTPATLNTALGSAGITIDGITNAEEPDTHDEDRQALWRNSAATLHFSVT